MRPDPADDFEALRQRLQFLARVVEREASYLAETDARLFAEPMTASRAASVPPMHGVRSCKT